MTAAAEPLGTLLWKRWRDKAAWMTSADIVTVLLALALPWSTSLVGILGVVLVLVMLPTIDAGAFFASLKRLISAAPIALFALALVGTLWSEARWGLRFYAVAPTGKLLLLPLLFYHFERSRRGLWVFTAFLASCAAMVVVSWIVAFFPDLTLKSKDFASRGIFVKNYIDQSQEFALCAVALAYPIAMLLRAKKLALALALGALALGFLANMAFVIVSRTALVTIPIMLLAFAVLHLRWQTTLLVAGRLLGRGRVRLVRLTATGGDRRQVRAGISTIYARGRGDLDRRAAGILSQVAAVSLLRRPSSAMARDRSRGYSNRLPRIKPVLRLKSSEIPITRP